jgi:hypothetical protein
MVVAEMSEPSNENKSRSGSGGSGSGSSRSSGPTEWERRAADMANEVQRWLIRQGARNMRDEFSGQMKKALRGSAPPEPTDVWGTATTEPPDAASQPPECAWCPICRAARRMAQAQVAGQSGSSSRSGGGGSGGGGSGGGGSGGGGAGAGVGPTLAGATDAIVGAARDALTGIDAILSYRPGDLSAPKPAPTSDPVSDPTQDSTQDSASADGAADSDGQPVVDSQPASSSQAGEHEHEPDHRG